MSLHQSSGAGHQQNKRLRSQVDGDLEITDPADSLERSDLTDCVCIVIKGTLKEKILQYISTITAESETPKKVLKLTDSEPAKKWLESYDKLKKALDANMRSFQDDDLTARIEDEEQFESFKVIRGELTGLYSSGQRTLKMLQDLKVNKPHLIQSNTTIIPNKLPNSVTKECLQKINNTVIELDNELCQQTFDRTVDITDTVVNRFYDVSLINEDDDEVKKLLFAKAWRQVAIRFRKLDTSKQNNPNNKRNNNAQGQRPVADRTNSVSNNGRNKNGPQRRQPAVWGKGRQATNSYRGNRRPYYQYNRRQTHWPDQQREWHNSAYYGEHDTGRRPYPNAAYHTDNRHTYRNSRDQDYYYDRPGDYYNSSRYRRNFPPLHSDYEQYHEHCVDDDDVFFG